MTLLSQLEESELKCDPAQGGAGHRAWAGGAGGRAGPGEEAGPIKCSLSQRRCSWLGWVKAGSGSLLGSAGH